MTAPARLLALRLQGFKSFAERTVVEFGPGISAVVGPNGSGKSNLADALRWALGEQGRALRSRKSEDVIFAGSERRAALGMADVTLVLDNSDGLLPVEYGVLELGRRLYRSGENDYLLNKQRVRLRDLVDLLDSAHLADNAFLFIGQGMVDQALALRPEERRPLFEEVAGVRRHERRRRKAEDQLAEAEVNLARVDDILAELRPQARRLAAQAEQQITRASAGDELAAALVAAAHGRWHEAATRGRAAAIRLQTARADADAAMAELTDAEASAAAISTALGARAETERSRREAHELARTALAELTLRDARLTSDAAAIDRDRVRVADERRAAEADLVIRRREATLPIPDRDAALESTIGEVERELAVALEEIGRLRSADAVRGEEQATLRRAEAARAAEVEAARRRLADAERRAVDERRHADESEAARVDLATQHAAAVQAATTAAAAETATIAAREAARAGVDAAEGSARSSVEDAAAAGSRTAALRGSVEAARVRAAEEEARGIARAARRVGGRRLDDDLQVEPGLRAAVEAALGEAARAYLVDRDAVPGLAGERGMVVVDRPAAAAARRDAAFHDQLASVGGGILAEAVRRDPSGAARRILGRAAWVPDLGAVLQVQPLLPDGWVVVSRDGSALAGALTIALGRAEGTLERRSALERSEVELARAEAAAVELGRAAEAAQGAVVTARAELERARAAESHAVGERRAADETERAAGRLVENATREAGWAAALAERAETEVVRAGEALAAFAADRPTGRATPAGSSADATALTTWEERAADLRVRRDRLAGQLGVMETSRREAESTVARAVAAATYDEQRIARADADDRSLTERETAMAAERDRLAVDLSAAVAREQAARAVLDELRAADTADRERLLAAEGVAGTARERLRAADDRVRAAEVADLESRLALDAIREQVLVELAGIGPVGIRALRAVAVGFEAAGAKDARGAEDDSDGQASDEAGATDGESGEREEADRLDAERSDLETAELEAVLPFVLPVWEAAPPETAPPSAGRLASLRRRFHELGAANPYAVEEYAELKARLESLETQGADLHAAIARTRSLIDELTTMIVDQFQSTFRALETAFDERFKQLFGGGFARLDLTDPTDLATTGVEIVARPPGKKAQTLAMLSGGERALTAVALLFAMLQVRPVPFCVLDEVDAALDEANVGRFSDALRGLADQTQFIVITHNRGTIEAADALYGVTVGDDSISRVISLRLDEATAIAAKAGGNGVSALDPVAG